MKFRDGAFVEWPQRHDESCYASRTMSRAALTATTLAVVDLGSNSFHCQVVRVVGDQIYPLDSLREPVRLGAGLTKEKRLDEAAQERALACLKRFGERLRVRPCERVPVDGVDGRRRGSR